ncbi:hypothetical protein LOC67_18365 [Stieleria sp. JC731]|uniref:hypothetical protein n=1 Tax=Pirellulaceae TaxID=2691357 RepID=UPI001E60D7D2|nr:hypothetical protein [Stieleria sp. JC731]MCC9602520.1 hypothetical protein [Stieleria sp. JC731]
MKRRTFVMLCGLGIALGILPERFHKQCFAQPNPELFERPSASQTDSKWALILVTDEASDVHKREKLLAADKEAFTGPLWCESLLQAAVADATKLRPGLKEQFVIQRVAAGLPSNVFSDPTQILPRQSILFICDRQLRVMNFCVGVPDSDDLLRLLEEAEETSTLFSLNENNPKALSQALLQWSKERVLRHYREFIEEQAIEDFVAEGSGSEDNASNKSWRNLFRRYVTGLQPVYQFDANLRFTVAVETSTPRSRVLEQHCETRHDWCVSVSPLIVSKPIEDVISPIVDAAWRQPPVIDTDEKSHSELIRWFDSRREVATTVLAIEPELLAQQFPWPPPNVNPKMEGRSWVDLQKVLAKHAYRQVTVEQLAVILEHSEQKNISLTGPSRLRYVVFQQKKPNPILIRESDLPHKLIRQF